MNYPALCEFRKTLHQQPELSGQEYETARLIAARLRRLQPDHLLEGLGKTGILAIFGQDDSKPLVFFRAELDALPIQEINNFAHRSQTPGISHKCGHDGHSSILLGLAERFAEAPLDLRLGLLFQPAEENGSGALAVLQDERFRGFAPDYMFALHNLPGYPLHQVVLRQGSFTPAVKSVIYKLEGKTAHAAEPENGINPALAMAEIWQAAAKRSQNNLQDLASITPIHAWLGEPAYGVSAGSAELHFTLRCWTNTAMQKLEQDLLSIVQDRCQKYGLQLQQESLEEFQANQNAAKAIDIVQKACEQAQLNWVEQPTPMKWGEDFGAFTQQFTGAMLGLGAGEDCPALHHPDYDFPDALLPTGVELFYHTLLQIQSSS